MSQKQGGKGKTSSPSRKASHLRGPARTAANKIRKMARHAKRHGLNKYDMERACNPTPDFPRRPLPRGLQKTIFDKPVRENYAGLPIHVLTVAGMCVTEFSPWRGDVDNAKRETLAALGFTHDELNPLTGRRTRIDSRADGGFSLYRTL